MTDNIITPELVALDANFGGTTTEVITNLATLVQGAGRATSTDVLAGAPTVTPTSYSSLRPLLVAVKNT